MGAYDCDCINNLEYERSKRREKLFHITPQKQNGCIDCNISECPWRTVRKQGHWIGGDGSYICSECGGNPMDFIDTMGISFDAYIETPMNYCPHCGADMRGIEDG